MCYHDPCSQGLLLKDSMLTSRITRKELKTKMDKSCNWLENKGKSQKRVMCTRGMCPWRLEFNQWEQKKLKARERNTADICISKEINSEQNVPEEWSHN